MRKIGAQQTSDDNGGARAPKEEGGGKDFSLEFDTYLELLRQNDHRLLLLVRDGGGVRCVCSGACSHQRCDGMERKCVMRNLCRHTTEKGGGGGKK